MEPPREDSGEPDDERRQSGADEHHVEDVPAGPDERLQDQQTPTEAEHRSLERSNWNVQNRIAGVAAVVGVLQLIGLVLVWQTLVVTGEGVRVAQDQARIAQEGLVSGARPWLEFETARLDAFQISERELSLALTLDLKNVGHGVAKGTRAVVDVVARDDPDETNAAAERLCGDKVLTGVQRGTLIFPDATRQVTGARTRSLREVLSGEQVTSIAKHVSDEANFGRSVVGSSAGTGDDADTRSKLSVVGCVSYELQDKTIGRTTFVGSIRDPSRVGHGLDANLIEFNGDVTFGPNDVRLEATPGVLAD